MVYVSSLPPAICVGMMLLAASPGGTSAALYTHLARGDVALTISLTAITSLLSMITLPIVASLSLLAFQGEEDAVAVPFQQVLQIFMIAIVPALIGAFINRHYPALAARMDRPVKMLSALFLAAVVVAALVGQWGLLATWGTTVGTLALAFSLTSFAVGYYVPRLLRIERRQAVALAMSIGLHNAALVITLAISEYMLNSPEMAIPPAAYGVIAYIVGGVFAWMITRQSEECTADMTGRLEGKIALVIGAARGIGKGIAERFAEEGARLVLADTANEAGEATARELGATFVRTNISSMADAEAAVAVAVERFGRLDIMVQNAGIYPWQLIEDTSPEDWDRRDGREFARRVQCSEGRTRPDEAAGVGPDVVHLVDHRTACHQPGPWPLFGNKGWHQWLHPFRGAGVFRLRHHRQRRRAGQHFDRGHPEGARRGVHQEHGGRHPAWAAGQRARLRERLPVPRLG